MSEAIGIDVDAPEEACEDRHCPFHGTLKVRGQVLEGDVVSAKNAKSAIVAREYYQEVPKYERFERRTSKVAAHNPPCIGAEEGERVTIAECSPISKTKRFVIVEQKGENA